MDYRIDEELEEEMQAQLEEEEIPEEELEFDEKYAQLSDNELAALANSDDSHAQDYLLNKYKTLSGPRRVLFPHRCRPGGSGAGRDDRSL